MQAARRSWLMRAAALAGVSALPVPLLARPAGFDAITPRPLVFPRDFGAHPGHRTEWWYLTGWVRTRSGQPLGIQVTFFRARPGNDAGPIAELESQRGRFAPTQLLFAHAAIADPAAGVLWHDERAARLGAARTELGLDDTRVRLGSWTLQRSGPTQASRYTSTIEATRHRMVLQFDATRPVWLQGEAGFSRKGPEVAQASHYYSQVALKVEGELQWPGGRERVEGQAWMDHEWSSTLLHPEASGWDWVGMLLDDGRALKAFQVRHRNGSALWTEGAWQWPNGRTQAIRRIGFEPLRQWRSSATRTDWPVAQRMMLDGEAWETRPLFDAQELDSRGSVGAVYWEGASELWQAGATQAAGRGYLEMTGYHDPIRL